MSKPTPATEYDNALDKADFYRRKWLEIKAERDALLAALEGLLNFGTCANPKLEARAYRAAHQAVAAARGVCVLVVPPVPRPGGAAQELREALQSILRAHMYPESFGDDLSVAMARAYTLLQTDDQPLTGGE